MPWPILTTCRSQLTGTGYLAILDERCVQGANFEDREQNRHKIEHVSCQPPSIMSTPAANIKLEGGQHGRAVGMRRPGMPGWHTDAITTPGDEE